MSLRVSSTVKPEMSTAVTVLAEPLVVTTKSVVPAVVDESASL